MKVLTAHVIAWLLWKVADLLISPVLYYKPPTNYGLYPVYRTITGWACAVEDWAGISEDPDDEFKWGGTD